jgi:beta-glucosidase
MSPTYGYPPQAMGLEHILTISDFVWGIRDGPASVKAGLDVGYPSPAIRSKTLPAVLASVGLNWASIEQIEKRLPAAQLTYYARIYHSPTPAKAVICSREHRSIAHDAAAASMVLLKNKSQSRTPLLPLDQIRCTRVVVVGALAVSTQTGDSGFSNLNDPDVISPLEGLKLASHEATVVCHSGKDIAEAVKDAASADAVVFITGLTGKQEEESVASTDAKINDACLHGPFTGTWFVRRVFGTLISGVQRLGLPLGGDRRELNLQPHDEKLGSALAAAVGDKLIMVISASGTIILPEVRRSNTAAILFSGHGGCRYGTALKDVLLGLAAPSGRLSFVVPETLGDISDWDPSTDKVAYNRWWGYRLMQKKTKQPVSGHLASAWDMDRLDLWKDLCPVRETSWRDSSQRLLKSRTAAQYHRASLSKFTLERMGLGTKTTTNAFWLVSRSNWFNQDRFRL